MQSGGEGGIRTPGTGLSQYDGLANRCFRPLSHLSLPRECSPQNANTLERAADSLETSHHRHRKRRLDQKLEFADFDQGIANRFLARRLSRDHKWQVRSEEHTSELQ